VSHVSHSQLGQWLRCGKAYELNRIMQAPRVPAVWTASGVALHEVIDMINRASITGDRVDIRTEWNRVYGEILHKVEWETNVPREQWKRAGRQTKDKPNKEDSIWWGIEGLRQLLAYEHWLNTSGYKIVEIDGQILSEFETTTTFGDVTVKGFLDAVIVDPNENLLVMDAKSGTRVPTSQIQLALYAQSLRLNLGIEVKQGVFFMTRQGELTDTYDLTRYTEQYFTTVFSGLNKGVQDRIFLPNPGDACFTCDVRDACYTVGGIDAWKYDSLSPNFVAATDLTVSSS